MCFVVSDSETPWTARFFCPWNFLSRVNGVGRRFSLQRVLLTHGCSARLLSLLCWEVGSLPLCQELTKATADMAGYAMPSDCYWLSAYLWHWRILQDVVSFWHSCLRIQVSQLHLTSNQRRLYKLHRRGATLVNLVQDTDILLAVSQQNPWFWVPWQGTLSKEDKGGDAEKKTQTPEKISFFFWLIFIFWKLSWWVPCHWKHCLVTQQWRFKEGMEGLPTTHLVPEGQPWRPTQPHETQNIDDIYY